MKNLCMTMGLLAAVAAGCQQADAKTEATAEPALLHIGSRVLTVADVQAEVDKLPLERRVEVANLPEQEAFVKRAIDQRILAFEAERLGYDRAPEVLAAARRAMVVKLLKERIGDGPKPGEVTLADARRYYDEHIGEFGPPERMRVAVILVKDATKARVAHAEAELAIAGAAKQGGTDERFGAFQSLVKKYTEEEGARDVTISLQLSGAPYPEPVIEAARALKELGSVTPVIATPSGNFIVQLKERMPAAPLPFERVKDRATRAVSERLRDRKTAELVASLTKRHAARVHTDQIPKVRFEPDPMMLPAAGPSR
jgi:parvulin-like peptidyl-prolyl isomerase